MFIGTSTTSYAHRVVDKLGRTTEYVAYSTSDGKLQQDTKTTYDADGRQLNTQETVTNVQTDFYYYTNAQDSASDMGAKAGRGALAKTVQHKIGSSTVRKLPHQVDS